MGHALWSFLMQPASRCCGPSPGMQSHIQTPKGDVTLLLLLLLLLLHLHN